MIVPQSGVPIMCNGQKFFRAGTVCERSFNNSAILPPRSKTLTAAAAARLQHQTRNFQKTGHLLSSGCTVVAVSGTMPRKAQQLAKELRRVAAEANKSDRIYERPAIDTSDQRERKSTQSQQQSSQQQAKTQNTLSNESRQQSASTSTSAAATAAATTSANCSGMKQKTFSESPRDSFASSDGSGSGEYERVRYTVGDLAPFSSQCNSKGGPKQQQRTTGGSVRKSTDRHAKKPHDESTLHSSLRRNSSTYNAPGGVDEVYVPDSVFCRDEAVKPKTSMRFRSVSPSPHQSESSARSSQTPEDPQPVDKATTTTTKSTPTRTLTRKNSLPSSIYSTLPAARAYRSERDTHTLPTKFRRSHSYSDGTDLRSADRPQRVLFRTDPKLLERRPTDPRRGSKTVSVNYIFDPASGTIHQVRNTTEYFTSDGRPLPPPHPSELSDQKVTPQHQTPRAVKRRNRTLAAAHAMQELSNNVLLLDEVSLARLLETDMLALDKSFAQPVVCAGAYAPRLAQRPFTPLPTTSGGAPLSLRTAMPAVTRSSGRALAPKRHSDASTCSAGPVDPNDSRHWDAKKFKYRNKKVQFSDIVTKGDPFL